MMKLTGRWRAGKSPNEARNFSTMATVPGRPDKKCSVNDKATLFAV